jgi:hypothetical protein
MAKPHGADLVHVGGLHGSFPASIGGRSRGLAATHLCRCSGARSEQRGLASLQDHRDPLPATDAERGDT